MKIAVLSGKGGTGKTTVSVSLAKTLGHCQYIDCDVEEPNGFLFLQPKLAESLPVMVPIPSIDEKKCDGCGKCAASCQFNALAVIKKQVLVFSELCHHCGACLLACPQKAITEVTKEIGVLEKNEEETFLHGRLNVGEPMSIPIIRELKQRIKSELPVVLDCPPGASCAVVQSIEDCDYCLLVAEPTPFGLHDLHIALQLVKMSKIPCGIVVNKHTPGNNCVHDFSNSHGVQVLMEIPFSREIAQDYSKGELPFAKPFWQNKFSQLYQVIERGAEK